MGYRDKKVVVIGGGTGSFHTLKGLKHYTKNITAIVSMFDSGGSTGTLRDEFGTLPAGDIRKCLLALAHDTNERTLRQLFTYRFPSKSSLNGHSFGNLFITALTNIYSGDICKAIEQAGEMLKIKGKIYPVTKSNCHLKATLEDGQEIIGESNIDIPKHDATLKIKKLNLTGPAIIYSKAKQAIIEADTIVLGPGDLYTSILPNMLVQGMKESLKKTKACKIYVCNIMTKFGETNNFKASTFLREILRYSGQRSIDFMICNTKKLSDKIIRKYKEEKASPVQLDYQNIRNVRLLCGDIVQEHDLARHSPIKLAKLIMSI